MKKKLKAAHDSGSEGNHQSLDRKYLGQYLPGNPDERAELLGDLREWLEDPKKGP